VGDRFILRLSYLIFGYSLLISYGDFTDLGMSPSVATVMTLLAIVIILYAIISLSLYYFSQPHIIHQMKQDISKLEHHPYQKTPAEHKEEAKNIKKIKIKIKRKEE